MKFLIPFLFSMFAQAKGFVCMPNPHDTQLSISWTDKEVIVKVLNPMGYKYMPQMENVSAGLIPFLKMQTEDLKSLDDGFTYRWSVEKCDLSRVSEKLISCDGKVNNDKETGISALGFTTAKLTEESLITTHESLRVRLSVNVENGNIYFVAIPFPISRCF
jgi:hypothetical protein